MSTDMMDIPYVFTATWIGLLGAYLLWMSQCSRSNKGTPDSPNFGFADGSDDADTASVTSDEYPPFSPKGMISWMFGRCNRRFESAMEAGDTIRAQTYNQRRALLADFMNSSQLQMTMKGIKPMTCCTPLMTSAATRTDPQRTQMKGEDNRSLRMRTGHLAMINLQGAMAMQLHGCASGTSPTTEGSWFGFAFLTTWTMLDWILMVYDALWQELQACSGAVVS